MKSLLIALSMYSKFPVPQVEWEEKSLRWALCYFPVVGLLIVLPLRLWLCLWPLLGLDALGPAGAVLLPIALSGAIHMDGLCDTCDALSSHRSREEKLRILKDSHAGAFAIICCALYLLVFYAAWSDIRLTPSAATLLSLTPFLSRCLSGLAAVSWQNARGTGLLATFTTPMEARKARLILLAETAAALLAAVLLCWYNSTWELLTIPAAALLTFAWYYRISHRQFGGITGDTEGFFLQLCECAMVVAGAAGQHLLS
jgi:adenosylcobinamide-GDP ribazoletransferase